VTPLPRSRKLRSGWERDVATSVAVGAGGGSGGGGGEQEERGCRQPRADGLLATHGPPLVATIKKTE
jgi:hypothetical protein